MRPAKTVGRNEMPFGRDTYVVPSNAVLDISRSPRQEVIWRLEAPVRSEAANYQITFALVNLLQK